MNIHAYILCYNEEGIIRNTLAHYSAFCSRIFLMDNMSTDRSLEYAAQFDKVTVIPWQYQGIDQRMLVKMKSKTFRDYSREGGRYTDEVADWIIAVDADELVYHPDLPALLQSYKERGITVPDIAGFEIIDAREIDPQVPLTQQFRRGVRTYMFDKRVIFDVNFDMHYSGGCHPRGPGFEHMKTEYNYCASEAKEILLLHFKYIGKRHLYVAQRYLDKADVSSDPYRGAPEQYQRMLDGKINPQAARGKRVDVLKQDGSINYNVLASAAAPIEATKGLWTDRMEHAELLRDIALRLEWEQDDRYLRECRDLMLLARLFKPRGKVIREKLELYDSALAQSGHKIHKPSRLKRVLRRLL